ncbi:uncharacterized protein LOC143253792 [Tachypleus tridentatus]|uniref:uncharacterized protein LOC143253792 n=1 Tax=Tachypleus tridentatus TaxID=6853 RepID=UPI003FCF821C
MRFFLRACLTLPVLLSSHWSVWSVTGRNLTIEKCFTESRHVDVAPGSDVGIGVLLNVHEPGKGIYGCGNLTVEGVETYEILRWAVSLLNQDRGVINGVNITESFIPGIRLGLKVYDTCGHQEAALKQITEWFPEIHTGLSESCSTKLNASEFIIGLLDTTKTTTQPKVMESLQDYVTPSIPLDFSATVSPDRLAMTIAEVAHDMEWEKIAVFHADDAYSLRVVQMLDHVAMSGRICISKLEVLPSEQEDPDEVSRRKVYQKLLQAAAVRLEENAPVIVIGHAKIIQRLVQAMGENRHTVSRLQWFFSWIPDATALATLGSVLNSKNVFSLAPYPQAILQLENYWAKLQDSVTKIPEDCWFLEYVMRKKNCTIPDLTEGDMNHRHVCPDNVLRESPGQVLLRTSRATSSVHAVFMYAHALRKAWEYKCLGRPGMCPSLRKMSRKEFVLQYLEPLEYTLSANSRSPPEISGVKLRGSHPGQVDKLHLGLTLYTFDRELGVEPRQLVYYDTVRAHVVDSRFEYYPSKCPAGGCSHCVKVRNGRLEKSPGDSDGFVMISENADVIIPILLPIHNSGLTPLECSTSINLKAINDLEAALWMLDKINSNSQFIPGISLGAVVIDTCDSSLKSTQRLFSFLANQTKNLEKIDVRSVLAVVCATSSEVASKVKDILNPLNLTSVATVDLLAKNKRNSYSLQIAIPVQVRVKAIIEIMRYFGWTFVAVVHSTDYITQFGIRTFTREAKLASICTDIQVSLEEVGDSEVNNYKINKAINELVDAKRRGAKAVILWLNKHDSDLFFTALQKAISEGIIHRGDFIWLINSGRGEDVVNLEKFGEIFAGSLVFQGRETEVQEFVTYFHQLRPARNKRNPWFQEYWNAHIKCTGPECSVNSGVTRIMQAVLSIASGLARFRNELCHAERGLCPHLLRQPSLRHILNQYIRYTASARPNENEAMFMFTNDGVGDIPVEIFNLKKGISNTYSYQKVGFFHNGLTSFGTMVTYGSQGNEISMTQVLSDCKLECARCVSMNPNFLTVTSPDGLYLAAAIGVHKPSANFLQCGDLNSDSGLQQVEAFLWALDQVNKNLQILPGVTLGGVVLDTCSSQEKTSQSIINFLSQAPTISKLAITKDSPRTFDNIMGFFASQQYDVVKTVADFTVPQRITTIGLEDRTTEFNNLNWYDYLLRFSLPNNLIADAIVKTLQLFRWNYVSVVYSYADRQYSDLFQNFKTESEKKRIQLALTEKVSEDVSWTSHVLQALDSKWKIGARVVVLLLRSEHLEQLLHGLQMITRKKAHSVVQYVWVTYDNLKVFQRFPEYVNGVLSIRPMINNIPEFQEYFRDLDIRKNFRNIWFREYWERVFRCRGAACYSGLQSSLRDIPFVQDAGVANVVEGVFALAQSLEAARAQLCPRKPTGTCPQMKENIELREIILNLTKTARTEGQTKQRLFTGSNYGTEQLEILTSHQVGSGSSSFIKIGSYTELEGLNVNVSRFNNNGHKSNPLVVTSSCLDNNKCGDGLIFRLPSVMKRISANNKYVLISLMSVHQKGETFFSCGSLNPKSFQNLAALMFAVDEINNKRAGNYLGLVVLDDCSRVQRAEEKLFHYLDEESEERLGKSRTKSQNVIAALTFNHQVAINVSPLLQASLIPQVVTSTTWSNISKELIPSISSPLKLQVSAVVALLAKHDWKYVYVILTNDLFGQEAKAEFSAVARRHKICVAESIGIDIDVSVENLSKELNVLSDLNVNVVVMLTKTAQETQLILQAADRSDILDRYVWVITEGWNSEHLTGKALKNKTMDALVVKLENHDIQEFRQFLTKMTLLRHDKIPDAWFEEFWQHHFRCRLLSSLFVQRQYSNVCTGQERFTDVRQAHQVYHTITTVRAIGRAIHSSVAKGCSPFLNTTICEGIGEEINRALQDLEGGREDHGSVFGYQIFKVQNADGQFFYREIGQWRNYNLDLYETYMTSYGSIPTSVCYGSCEKCTYDTDHDKIVVYRVPLYRNFNTDWGIIVTVLSFFGICMVIVCIRYFLVGFPVSKGNTVLGYVILFGTLILYAVNFAFVLVPTTYICGVRLFVMSMAYTSIVSGMLVTVMNAWKMADRKNRRSISDRSRFNTPASLLVMTVGLVTIEILLTTARLALQPLQVGEYSRVWMCSPPSVFENELVISLVYVILLLVLSIFFSTLTWKCSDGNREPRWILLSCALVVLVWLAWTAVSSLLHPEYRDLTIVVANLMCATIVMLCLYLRKACLYVKFTKQECNIKVGLESPKKPRTKYGALQKEGGVVYGSRISLHKMMYGGGPFFRRTFANVMPDGANSNSNQPQVTDLYPLEMYSGSSQFPTGSAVNQKETLALGYKMTIPSTKL